jgi:hypothetical protein
MKKINVYVLLYFIVIIFVASIVSCTPSKGVTVNPCENMVVKTKGYNPNHLLPYRH